MEGIEVEAKRVPRAIERARTALGLSLRDVKKLSGVAASTIYRMETDPDYNPTIGTLRKLAAVYAVHVDDLWPEHEGGDEELNVERSFHDKMQTEVGDWGDLIFDTTPPTMLKHLGEEVIELTEAVMLDIFVPQDGKRCREEIGDCQLLLWRVADGMGVSAYGVALEKHRFNLKRKWDRKTGRHIDEGEK